MNQVPHHRRTMSEASSSTIAAALLENSHYSPLLPLSDHRPTSEAAATTTVGVSDTAPSTSSDDQNNNDSATDDVINHDDRKISSTLRRTASSLSSSSSSSSISASPSRGTISRLGGRRFSDAMQYRLQRQRQHQRLETEIEKKRRQHAQWKRYREHRDRVVRELTQGSDSTSMLCSCHCGLFVCREQDPFESVTHQEYTCFVDACCNGNVNPLSPAQMKDVRANEPLSRIVLSISEHVWAILVRLQASLIQGRRQRASEKWMQTAVDRSWCTLMKLQSKMMHDHWNRQGQGQERRQMHSIQYWFNHSSDKKQCCSIDGRMGSGEEEMRCKECSKQYLKNNAAESAGSDLQSQSGPEEEFLINRCIEKWLFEHLHPVAFQITEQDAIRDDDLRNRLTTFRNFIEPLHLGLKAELSQHPDFTNAVISIRKINHYTTPSTKLRVVTCALDSMFKALKSCYPNQEDQNSDLMLPVTVLLLLRSNPRNIHSNMQYMRMWCGNEKVNFGMSGFWFTTLEAGVWFIERAGESSFEHMEPREYMRSIKANAGGILSHRIVWDWH